MDRSGLERAVDELNAAGLEALAAGDRERAIELFAQAAARARERLADSSLSLNEALYNRATHPPPGLSSTERASDLERVIEATEREPSERARALTASACHNLAVLREQAGDVSASRDLYVRALDLRQSLLGPDHPRLRPTLVRLAQLEHAAGRTLLALSLYERALVLARAELGPDHREIVALERWRADLIGEG